MPYIRLPYIKITKRRMPYNRMPLRRMQYCRMPPTGITLRMTLSRREYYKLMTAMLGVPGGVSLKLNEN